MRGAVLHGAPQSALAKGKAAARMGERKQSVLAQ